MSSLDPERIQALLLEYIRREIDEHKRAWEATGPARDEWGERLDITGELLSDLANAWEDQDLSTVRRQVDEFIAAHGLAVERGSPEYRELSRSMLKAEMQVFEAVRPYQRGESVPDSPGIVPAVPTPPRKPTPLLSAAIRECLDDRAAQGEIKPSTRAKDEAVLALFLWVVGDKPVGHITAEDMGRFRSVLPRLPAQMKKHKQYAGLSVDEVLAMSGGVTTTPQTNENRASRVQAFWTWALDRGMVTEDLRKNVRIKGGKSRPKEPFTVAELERVFLSPRYVNETHSSPWRYWLPLLGACTGARVGELVQLYPQDVEEVDSVWSIRIDDLPDEDDTPKGLKTDASRRIVPIHPLLRRKGFIEFAQAARERGDHRLFPDLFTQTDPSKYASKEMIRYLQDCGVHVKNRKVFHSFRHTFIAMLRRNGVTDSAIAALVGHESDTQTSRYGGSYSLSTLMAYVEAIQYPEDMERVPPFRLDSTKPRTGPKPGSKKR